ncbi:MATE family efflux transporter [Persicobacter diffluens]
MSKIDQKILRLAIPNIISNITVPLLGMVDLALLGHLDDPVFLGAMALGSIIFNFLYWSFGFLRMGTTGLVAQAYGRNDRSEMRSLLFRALAVGVGVGLLCILFQWPIGKLGFYLVEGSATLKAEAWRYFMVRIWAAPATIGLYALMGWTIGLQNAKLPMAITLLINVCNVLLSAFFIYQLNMDVEGAALGTLMAQYLGFFVLGGVILYKYPWVLKEVNRSLIFNLKGMTAFFLVNRDIFIRTICLLLVFNFFTSASAGISEEVLAVNTLLMQFLMFFSYLIDGFAYAAEAIVGEYVGAKDQWALRKLVKRLFHWGLLLAALFSLSYWFGGELILSLLTNQEHIIRHALQYLPWVALIPLISFPSYLWDGIYIGATASKWMRNTMFLSTFLVFFPFYLVVCRWDEQMALWGGMLLFLISRGLFQWLFLGKAIPVLKRNNATLAA